MNPGPPTTNLKTSRWRAPLLVGFVGFLWFEAFALIRYPLRVQAMLGAPGEHLDFLFSQDFLVEGVSPASWLGIVILLITAAIAAQLMSAGLPQIRLGFGEVGAAEKRPNRKPLFAALVTAGVLFSLLSRPGAFGLSEFVFLLCLSAMTAHLGWRERGRVGEIIRRNLFTIDFLLATSVASVWMVWMASSLMELPNIVRGIEVEFFRTSLYWMSEHRNLWICGAGRFWSAGTFCAHPFGITMFQAIFMEIFGTSIFVWRFLSVLMTALGALGLHLFLRNVLSPAAALLGTTVFLGTYYSIQWSKMGYNNMYFVAPFLLALACAAIAIAYRSALFAFVAGILSTAGLYLSFLGLLSPFSLSLLFVPSLRRAMTPAGNHSRSLFPEFLAGALFMALPLLVHSREHYHSLDHVISPRTGSGYDPEFPDHRLRNIFQTAFLPFRLEINPLYLMDNYLFDFLSVSLALVGMFILMRDSLRADGGLARMLLAYMLLHVVSIGLTNIYRIPPTTRTFFWIITIAVYSAVGVHALTLRLSQRRMWIVSAAFLCLILFSNVEMVRAWNEKWTRAFNGLQVIVQSLRESNERIAYISNPYGEHDRHLGIVWPWYIGPNRIEFMDEYTVTPTSLQESVLRLDLDALVVDRDLNIPKELLEALLGEDFEHFPTIIPYVEGGEMHWYCRRRESGTKMAELERAQ